LGLPLLSSALGVWHEAPVEGALHDGRDSEAQNPYTATGPPGACRAGEPSLEGVDCLGFQEVDAGVAEAVLAFVQELSRASTTTPEDYPLRGIGGFGDLL
jgi:hypothetical protein